jgi:DNA-binding MarR family transcriptional regulator
LFAASNDVTLSRMRARRDDVEQLAHAVNDLVVGAHRGMAQTFDVNRIELLRLAAAGDAVHPGDAAAALAVNPSTVTRCARALEEEGLLTVAPDPSDGRSCLLAATDAGRAELARFDAAGAEVFAVVVQDWNAADVRRFTDLIERLGNAWQERGPVQTRPHPRAAPPRWRRATNAKAANAVNALNAMRTGTGGVKR